MFEKLTAFLPKLKEAQYGEWVVDRENDGSLEHHIQFPYVDYSQNVDKFEKAVYRFADVHQEMGLHRYGDILDRANIEWDFESMSSVVVSELDGKTVMALIIGAIRAERFCDGALLDFFENGRIIKWLSRLQQIDEQE